MANAAMRDKLGGLCRLGREYAYEAAFPGLLTFPSVGDSLSLLLNRLFRFQVQTALPGDGTAACAYCIAAACTWKRKGH